MAVRSRDTDIRNPPGEIPRTSASHSDRSRRGECSARIASNRRWLALGRSIAEPSTATACTPPSKRTLLIAGSDPTASTLSHAKSSRSPPQPMLDPVCATRRTPNTNASGAIESKL